MNELKYAFRRFFRRKGLNTIKVLSLGLGFAISFMMLAKVAFEHSYDSEIPHADRTYKVCVDGVIAGEKKSFENTPGAVAPGMKKEIPQVEVATRYTSIAGRSLLYTESKSGYTFRQAILADEYFFDIFGREVIAGDPKAVLTTEQQCMISDEIAAKIGGDVLGQKIVLRDYPNQPLTIGGVFKAFPTNSSFNMDVVIAMKTISKVTWDGSNNWIGNDRYSAFVRLAKGTDPTSLKEAIYRMQVKYQDIEAIKEKGVEMTYTLRSILDQHLSDKHLRTSVLLIGIIGLVVLVMSILNYILLRITSIINSSRNTAIMKCVGAGRGDIQKGIIADTFVHIMFAVVVGALFVVLFQESFGKVLEVSVTDLLTWRSALLGLAILIVSGLLISIGPGRIIASIPIISVMTKYRKANRAWKLSLLFVETLGATFLLCTVFFVHRQYNYSIRLDQGYDTQGVYYTPASSIDSAGIKNALDVLRNMPEVEVASLSMTVPFERQSGDNVFDPETEKELLHIINFFWCDKYFFDALRIPVVEGEGFDKQKCHAKHMLISRTCALNLAKNMGWSDGVVGKSIHVSSHYNPVTIIGVFEDLRTISFASKFASTGNIVIAGGAWHSFCEYIIIRLRHDNAEARQKVEEILNRHSMFGDISLTSAEAEVRSLYDSIRNIGHYTLFGSIVALIITFIGIVGYTEEEVTRRRKEVAIRMVNGASATDIIRLFLTDYLKVGVPAIITGLVAAYFAIRAWMQDFPDHIDVSLPILACLGLVILLVTALVMSLYCYFTATKNPIEYLAEE